MEIEEIRELRSELESEIAKMVVEFSNKTGVVVVGIKLPQYTIEEFGRGRGKTRVYGSAEIEVSI